MTIVPLATAVLLGACALISTPQFMRPAAKFLRSTRTAALPGLYPALYGLAALAAFLTILASLRLADILLRRLRRAAPPADQIRKPIELMLKETAVQLRAGRPLGAYELVQETPVQIPIPQPTSTQRKALHAAALMAIRSRPLDSLNASAAHRRSSDYQGPRRRATDNRAKPVYEGPYRRAGDSTLGASPACIATGPAEHNAGQDSGELNLPGLHYTALPGKTTAEAGAKPDSIG